MQSLRTRGSVTSKCGGRDEATGVEHETTVYTNEICKWLGHRQEWRYMLQRLGFKVQSPLFPTHHYIMNHHADCNSTALISELSSRLQATTQGLAHRQLRCVSSKPPPHPPQQTTTTTQETANNSHRLKTPAEYNASPRKHLHPSQLSNPNSLNRCSSW